MSIPPLGIATGLVAATVVVFAKAVRAGTTDRVRRRLAAGPHATRPVGGRSVPRAPAAVQLALDEAGLTAEAGASAWRIWVLAAPVMVGAAVLVGGTGLAGLAVVAVTGLPFGVLRAVRGRGDRRSDAALPDLVEDIARRLRTGSSLPQALAGAASGASAAHAEGKPLDPAADPAAALSEVVAAVERGGVLTDELDRWAQRRPRPAVALAVAALTLGVATGGPQARALDAVAATLRDRDAVRREATALAAQARASAAVMGFTPLVFAVVAGAADPRVAHVLLATPAGLACLASGIGLDAVAALWMLRITSAVA